MEVPSLLSSVTKVQFESFEERKSKKIRCTLKKGRILTLREASLTGSD